MYGVQSLHTPGLPVVRCQIYQLRQGLGLSNPAASCSLTGQLELKSSKKCWDLNPGACDDTRSRSLHNWGGPLTRRALQAIYTLAFICLLRSDEVLKIRRDHIEFVKDDNNSEYMVLTLPFRKTHQDGRTFSHLSTKTFSIADHLHFFMADVQPFYVYPLDEEEAHLCPVRAMAEWIKESQVTSGFMFRRFMAQDRPSAHEDTAMVSFIKFYKILIG
jgi:hypothetical protein